MASKWLKFAGIMAGVGAIIVIICLAIGGTKVFRGVFNKRIDIFPGMLHCNMGISDLVDDDFKIYYGDMEETINEDEFDDITFNVAAATVEVKEADRSDYLVKAEGVNKAQAFVDDNTLYIIAEGYEINVGDSGEVYVEVPKGAKIGNVNVEVGAGTVNFDYLDADTVDVEVGAGEVIFDKLNAKTVDVEIGAGRGAIKEGRIKHMDANVGLGSFEYEGSVTGDMKAQCGMGNIDMVLDGSEEDHNYEMECAMGNLSVGSMSSAGIAAEREVDNGAVSDFTLECGMGNMSIRFKD